MATPGSTLLARWPPAGPFAGGGCRTAGVVGSAAFAPADVEGSLWAGEQGMHNGNRQQRQATGCAGRDR